MQTNKWVSLELPIVNAQNKSNSSTFWKKIADSSTIEKVKDNTSALSDDECYYKNQIYLSNYFYKEKEDNLREKKNNNLKIKPLRYTQSASNALSYPINVKDFKNCLPKCKRNSFAEFDTNYIVLNKQNVNENKMEHCTLKQNSCLKTLNNNKCTFVIKKNNEDSKFKTKDVHTTLQQISNSYEKNVIKTLHCNHFDKTNKTLLPPPVKIMPYSGIKPQNNAIIKPIAFRPVLNKLNSNTKVIHRQSVGIDLTTSNKNLETQLSNENFCKSYKNIDNFENILHIDSKNKFKDQSQSISNLLTISSNSTQSVTSLTQASTSKYSNSSSYLQNVDFVFNKNIKSHFLQHKNSRLSLLNQKNNKNYNTISDYFDNVKEKKNNDKEIHNSNNCSSIYQFPPEIETTTLKKNKNYNILSSSMSTASLNSKFLNTNLKNQNFQNTLMYNSQNFVTDFNNQNKNNLTNSFSQNTSSSGASSAASTTLNNYSPSNNTKEKLFNVLNIDRCFTSLHITPSPSDSGIVDYETLIRDKEQELNSVRHAMEQNEEVLIRVYQEKEQQFKKEIFELKQKLKKNEKIDQELRKKLQECREVCQQLQNSVKLLTDDQNAQKKKRFVLLF